jgi:hypothetical protein
LVKRCARRHDLGTHRGRDAGGEAPGARHVGKPRKLTPHKLDHAKQLITEGKKTQAGGAAQRRRSHVQWARRG